LGGVTSIHCNPKFIAGQIPNNIQVPISNDLNGFVSDFGHWVIENYLEFGIWILGFHACLVPATPG
jgi:hypothetical protein